MPKETKSKKEELSEWDKKVDKWHMKTKCLMQPVNLPREEDHWYAPSLEIKLHLKNAWRNPENPLAHPKYVSHLWPKCNFKELLCLKGSQLASKVCILILWP